MGCAVCPELGAREPHTQGKPMKVVKVEGEGGGIISSVLMTDGGTPIDVGIGRLGILTVIRDNEDKRKRGRPKKITVPVMQRVQNSGAVVCLLNSTSKMPRLSGVATVTTTVLLLGTTEPFGMFCEPFPTTPTIVVAVQGVGITRAYPFIHAAMLRHTAADAETNAHPRFPALRHAQQQQQQKAQSPFEVRPGGAFDIILFYGEEGRENLAFTVDLDTWETDQNQVVLDRYQPSNSEFKLPYSAHRLAVHYVLSQPDAEWGGFTGSITRSLMSEHCELRNTTFYIAGPESFTQPLTQSLLSSVPASQLHTAVVE
ncbi:hypothetical protein DIPPA_02677 [Diplonema papillatum]|nr:hypothetical protein DIPPA_02677 [Diplonema papillatum]